MRVLKVLKNSKGNTLINVVIGASLIAGGAILVSQGIVSQRKSAVRLNKAGSGQAAAKNVIDNMKSKDNAVRTDSVNYIPTKHNFTAYDGTAGVVEDFDPKDGYESYSYDGVSPATNTDTNKTLITIDQSGARYYFAPLWRPDTSALVGSTDWVYESAMPGAFDNEVLDSSIDSFLISEGLHGQMTTGGNCGTTNLTSACEAAYNNDANIVMANSVHSWQSLGSIISRLAYFYNEYPTFCTEPDGEEIVIDSSYDDGIDSWIVLTETDKDATRDFFRDIIASDLINIPGAQDDSISVWLKIEREDLLSNGKTVNCNPDFEVVPPGNQINSGTLSNEGLKMTIKIEYKESDSNGNEQTKVAVFTNSVSQSRLGVGPSVNSLDVSALAFDGSDPYTPPNGVAPNAGNAEFCGEVREGGGDTGSSPTVSLEFTTEGVAAAPFCRLEYMRPNFGESINNQVQFVDAGQPDAADINDAIRWGMGYRDSGWFLCTMPPKNFQAGFDPEILDITDPYSDATNADGKKGLRRMQAEGLLSTIGFENIQLSMDNSGATPTQTINMQLKGLSEGEFRFSVKAVDASRSISTERDVTWKVDLLRPFAVTQNIRTAQDAYGRYQVGEFGQPIVGSLHVNGDTDTSNDWIQQLPGYGARPNEIALLNTLNSNFGQSADGESGELYQCDGGQPSFRPPSQSDYAHIYDVFGGGVKWYFGPSRPIDEIYKDGSGDTIEDYFENGAITGVPDANELLIDNCSSDTTPVVGPNIANAVANSGEYMVVMQLCDSCGDGASNQMAFRYWIADFTPQNSPDFKVEVNGGNTSLASNTFNMYQSGVSPVFEYAIGVEKPMHQIGRYASTKPLPVAAVCEVASSDAPFATTTVNDKDNYTYLTDRFHTNYVIHPTIPTDIYGNPNWVIDPNNEYSGHTFICSQPNLSNACQEDTDAQITGVIAGAAIDACGRFRPENPPTTKALVDASTEVNTYMVRGYSAGYGNGRNDRCNQVDCVPGYYCDQVGSVGGGSDVPTDDAGVCRAQDEIFWDGTNSYGNPGTAGGILRRTTTGYLGGAPPTVPECGVYSGTDFIGANCSCGWDRDCNNNITGIGGCNASVLKCTNGGVDCSASESAAGACLIMGRIGGVQIAESDISGRPNYINTSTSVTAYDPLMSGNTLNPAACLPDSNYRGYIAYDVEYSGTGTPAITYAESLSGGESANYDTNGGRCTWEKGTGAACGWQETRDNEHLRHQTNGHEWCVVGTNVYGDWEWTTSSSTDHATCVGLAASAYTDSACLADHGTACRDLELKPGITDFAIGAIRNCNNGSTPAPSAPTGTTAWVVKDGPYTPDGSWSLTGSSSCSGGLTWEYDGGATTCQGTWVGGSSSSCGGVPKVWSFASWGCNPGGDPCGAAVVGSTCTTAGLCFRNTSCSMAQLCGAEGIDCAEVLSCPPGGGGPACPADTCSSLGSPCTIGDTCDDVTGGTSTTPYTCNDTSSCGSYPAGNIQGDSCSTVGSTTTRIDGTSVQNYICSCGTAGDNDCENVPDGYSDPTTYSCTQNPVGKTCSRTDADTTYNYQCSGSFITSTYDQNIPSSVSSGSLIDTTLMPKCNSTTSCGTLDDAGASGTQNVGYCLDDYTDPANPVVYYRECEVASCTIPALECNYNETMPLPWQDDSNTVNIDFSGSCIATQGTCDNLPSNAASGMGTSNDFCPNLNPFGVDALPTCADYEGLYCNGENFTMDDGAGGTLNCTGTHSPMECFGDSTNPPKGSCSGGPGATCVPFTDCISSSTLVCEAKVFCEDNELYYANQSDCTAVHGTANCQPIQAYNLAGGYCGSGCPGPDTYPSEGSCENRDAPLDTQCTETRTSSKDWCASSCPTSVNFPTDPNGYPDLATCEGGGMYECENRVVTLFGSSSQLSTTVQSTSTYPLRSSGSSDPVSVLGLMSGAIGSETRICRMREISGPIACGGDPQFQKWSECIALNGNDPSVCVSQVESGTCQDKLSCSGTMYVRDDSSCVGSSPSPGDAVNAACCSGTGGGQSWVNTGASTSCFTKDTKLELADGSLISIIDVKVGDAILSSEGRYESVKSIDVFAHEGLKYSINSSEYFFTDSHPFKSNRGWLAINAINAKSVNPDLEIFDMRVGDKIYFKDNSLVEVHSIDAEYSTEPVVSIEVTGTAEYIANGFVVHNKAVEGTMTCSTPSGPPPSGDCDETSEVGDNRTCIHVVGGIQYMTEYQCQASAPTCYYMGDYSYNRVDNGAIETEELFCSDPVTVATAPVVTPASCSGSMGWQAYDTTSYDCTTAESNSYPDCNSNVYCNVQNHGDYFCSGGGSTCNVSRCECSGTYTPETSTTPSTKQWTTGACADAPERFRKLGSSSSGSSCTVGSINLCIDDYYSGGFPPVCEQITENSSVSYYEGTGSDCSGQAVSGQWGACDTYDIPNSGSCSPDPAAYDSMEVYCTPASAASCTATPNDSSGYSEAWGTSDWTAAESYVSGISAEACNGGLSSSTTLSDAGDCSPSQNGSTCYYAYMSGSGPTLYVNDATCSCTGSSTAPTSTCTESWCASGTTGPNNAPTAFTFGVYFNPATSHRGSMHVKIDSLPTDLDGDTLTYNYYFNAHCSTDVISLSSVSGGPAFDLGGTTTRPISSTGTCASYDFDIDNAVGSDFQTLCGPDFPQFSIAVSVSDGTDTVWGTATANGQNFIGRLPNSSDYNNTAYSCGLTWEFVAYGCQPSITTCSTASEGTSCTTGGEQCGTITGSSCGGATICGAPDAGNCGYMYECK